MDLHLKLPDENPRDGATSARLENRRFSALFINLWNRDWAYWKFFNVTTKYIPSGLWKCKRSPAGIEKSVRKYARRKGHLDFLPFQMARAVISSLAGWRREWGVLIMPSNSLLSLALFLFNPLFFSLALPSPMLCLSAQIEKALLRTAPLTEPSAPAPPRLFRRASPPIFFVFWISCLLVL